MPMSTPSTTPPTTTPSTSRPLLPGDRVQYTARTLQMMGGDYAQSIRRATVVGETPQHGAKYIRIQWDGADVPSLTTKTAIRHADTFEPFD
jgi:hypothetical protein